MTDCNEYATFWLQVQAVRSCGKIYYLSRLPIDFYIVAFCLASTSACVNPIVYAIMWKLCCRPRRSAATSGGVGGGDDVPMMTAAAAVESTAAPDDLQ